MKVNTSAFEAEIIDDLTTELCEEETFNQAVLATKVKLAVKEVIAKRNYKATNWEEEDILDDLEQFYSVVANVARYDYNQIGAEGELSHSENGISRTYVSRDSLFKGVHAFVGVI